MKRCRSAFVEHTAVRVAQTSHRQWGHSTCQRSRKVVTSSAVEGLSRRALLSSAAIALSSCLVVPPSSAADEEYDAMKTRRYVPNGRPSRTGAEPVNFDSKKKVFSVGDQLQGQEIKVGEGTREVERGSLVRAQWVISLADGYIVDDTTSTGSVVFRVGVGQVATGIEGAVIGMKTGGSRVVKGPADVFFSDITSGERTLVPKDSEIFMDILVQQIDPYGS